jgi:NADH-quinone oxidoreductase subunit C
MEGHELHVDWSDWRSELLALHSRGFTYLDFLTVIDRLDGSELVAHVVNVDAGRRMLVMAAQRPGDVDAETISDAFPGANWHEREAAEMFGMQFAGHPDPRPLLVHGDSSPAPLLKTTPLSARLATAWPGTAEESGSDRGGGGRRRNRVPGVLETWTAEES